MPNDNACGANQLMNSAEGVIACTDGIDLFIDDHSTSGAAAKDNDMEDLTRDVKDTLHREDFSAENEICLT